MRTLKDELDELVRKTQAVDRHAVSGRVSEDTRAQADREIRRIIGRIPAIAKKAAKAGKREARVLGPGFDLDGHCYVVRENIPVDELKQYILWDPKLRRVAREVYQYCQQQGLNPCADFVATSYGQYKGPNEIRITIRW